MSGALKSLVRRVVPQAVLDLRSDWIKQRREAAIAALPLAGKFDHIYRSGVWGRAGDGTMSSGEGTRDDAVVTPYVDAVSGFLATLPHGLRLVDIGAGDFSVGARLLPKVGRYVACDISSLIVEQNRNRYRDLDTVEFRVLDATEAPLPEGEIVTIRQVLQHLSNDQISRIVPKLAAFGAIIVTEAVPAGEGFSPNADHRPGFSTRVIESNSGVDLARAPFNLPHVEARILCEPQTGREAVGGLIRTTLYITEKGRALGFR